MKNKIPPLNFVEKTIHETLAILQQGQDIPQIRDPSFDAHKAACRQMPAHIREGRLKIAVVGAIKSGKSTFVNSLLGKDLVKRGAGVITSITTRVRKGRKNQACLYLKSWDDINSQLQNALLLFPDDGSDTGNPEKFDIRRKKDRQYLKKAYQTLVYDFPDTNTQIRPETLLMKHALCGFEHCRGLVQADEAVLCFASKEFDKHKAYTADPNKAFYVKDVCLDVFGRRMEPYIEIADCQGADSTDPAQLAQVLTYLESSNLIVYCISSRIGLRQSDMTFLKQIKNSGLLDHIIFINNCDFTEHETLDDLMKIETSIRDTLELLAIHPPLFSFSCLYNFFLNRESKLNKKELSRLKFWQEEKKMVHYCDLKTAEFNSFFKQVMDKNRYDLLISNHLKHLEMILEQVDQRAGVFLELLSSDRKKEETAKQTLNNLYHNASRLESIVTNSIPGAVTGLKHEIQSNLNDFFVHDKKAVLNKAQAYIQAIDIDVETYKSVAKVSGFKQILYLLFQDVKRDLDVYFIKTVNPELKKFVQTQEDRIFLFFQDLFDSYPIDLLKTGPYSSFETKPELAHPQTRFREFVDIEKIKKILGLQLPSQIFEAKYTPRIKTHALTEFGLKTLSQLLSLLFNSNARFSFSPGLKNAAKKIKKENQKIIKDQFEQYHMKLRELYFLPLIEAASREFKEKINERFNGYRSFKEKMEHLSGLERSEKKSQKNKVLAIKQRIKRLSQEIASCSDLSWP